MTAPQPESIDLVQQVESLAISPNESNDSSASSSSSNHTGLSDRGAKNSLFLNPEVEKILKVFRNLYDPDTNPEGIVNLGVADNSLCRPELLRYFNEHRLHLAPAELTYADRFTTSSRLLDALCKLFNKYPFDWPEQNPSTSPLPIKKVEPDHIAIASGASGILDELFWCICNPGEGVLLSSPYYNAFDHDLTARANTKILEVVIPAPKTQEEGGNQDSFSQNTVKSYEDRLLQAQKDGIKPKALLLCNPHNPTGAIYPRKTIVELAKLAAKYKIHFVSDEIYARSCFKTTDVPNPEPFISILSIDTLAEAGLDPSYVHVVTSASKDFAINGFRLGVMISQHNKTLMKAMTALGLLSQSSAPAGALWYTWLEDEAFLKWYLQENRRRISLAYKYVTDWAKHYKIPYVGSNSGFFFMIDFRDFIKAKEGASEKDARQKEAELVGKLIKEKVFVAPGTQYHHPTPGFFRFTFTQDPKALKTGLTRLESALGLQGGFEQSRPLLDLEKGGEKAPIPAKLKEKSPCTVQ